MTELKVKWNKKSIKRSFAAFLAVCVCAGMIQLTPVQLLASNIIKAATAGNGTDSTTTTVTTAGNGTTNSTDTSATTAGNGTTTDTTVTTAGNGTATSTAIASITLSKKTYTYDGKAKTPAVTVKDANGNVIASANYTVAYSNNKKVGTAKVTVTGTGSCTGTKSAAFKINPKKTSISKIQANSKGFKVTWKKQATQTTGYQVRYSTSSKFTNATTVKLSKNTTTSKSVSKLSANKKYYVQVRTYKTVGGKTFYSGWSSSVIVTTKR